MTLIIRDQLVNPPTWFASFRDVTLYCHIFLHDDVIIESEDPDPYVRWMRPRGGMDFVEDFVRPGAEDGVHLDVEPNFPRAVITDRIAPENVHRLIAKIRSAAGWRKRDVGGALRPDSTGVVRRRDSAFDSHRSTRTLNHHAARDHRSRTADR